MRFLFASLCAAVMLVHSASAQDDHDQARRALQSGKIVALTTILAQVEEQFAGRVVEVELIEDATPEQGFVYKVELLTSAGALIEVFYDARSGNPIAMGGQGFLEDSATSEHEDKSE